METTRMYLTLQISRKTLLTTLSNEYDNQVTRGPKISLVSSFASEAPSRSTHLPFEAP